MNYLTKLLLTCCMVIFIKNIEAQVIVNLQLPQTGIHLNSQLWNMTLVNARNVSTEIRIDMVLSEAQSGDPILTGSSRGFYLPSGTRQIQLTDLIPIQYNVINSQYGASASADGFLPVGHYVVCFSIFKRDSEVFEKIAEECETIIIEPASPPILVYPEDESVIAENRPLFLWIPPAPSFLFSNLSYKFTLVEVLENQQPGDAVQNNLPILQMENLANSFLQYPATQPALDTGKLYAWFVEAYNNFQPVSNTETFSFRLITPRDSLKLITKIYTVLKNPDELKFTVAGNTLYYEYVNTVNNDSLLLELFDVSNSKAKKINLPQSLVAVKPGQNFLEIDLANVQGMTNHHIYLLHAKGRNQITVALKFIYQTAE